MKKERLFYLDFIRAIAMFLILLTHYNAHYLFYMNPQRPESAILTLFPFDIYIGNLGVSLFFIISGAALMYVYQNQCRLRDFYRKRFCSIYPMFWIAYFIIFLYLFFCTGQMPFKELPKMNFLWTILGMDGYLAGAVPVFYIIGEWFLGCIILIYLVFPLLRKCLLSHPVIFCVFITALYIPFAFYEWFPNFGSAKLLMVRFPEIIFGMLFVWKIKKPRWWMAAAGAVILAATTIFHPAFPESFETTYVGISFFLVLAWISSFITSPLIGGIVKTASKYSYAVFLVHHVIIDQLALHFPMEELNRSERYLLFILYCCLTALAANLLHRLHDRLIKALRENPLRRTA